MGQCCTPQRKKPNQISSTPEPSSASKVPEDKHKKPGMAELTLNKQQFVFEHQSDNIRDDYLIGKILGTGAFGEVRLCTHRKTGVKRAVKIIKKSFLKGKEETRFLGEIDILK